MNQIYNPKLKLFISIDFIDSTSFKSKEFLLGKNLLWSMQFLSLKDDFSAIMLRELNYLDSVENDLLLEKPSVWKMLGDEVIYSVDITEDVDIKTYILAAINSILKYNNSDDKEKLLKIKGSSWLAETPVHNAIIKTSCGNHRSDQNNNTIKHDHSFDVIGPSMDIGFRIAKFASKKKFIIAVELAEILTKFENASKRKNFHFFFDGEQEVKGVLDSHKYPIIWIDVLNRFQPIEEELLGLSKKEAKANRLYEFCINFIKDNKYILQSNKVPTLDDEIYKKKYEEVCLKIYNISANSTEKQEYESNTMELDIEKIKEIFPNT